MNTFGSTDATSRMVAQKTRAWWSQATIFVITTTMAALSFPILAQVPPPGLTITPSGSSQYLIKITNGLSTANYELYRTFGLSDPLYPWTLHTIGTLGQTNFTVNSGIEYLGFFQAAVGLDWDGDGIANWQDADPLDNTKGLLSITITSPANGSTLTN